MGLFLVEDVPDEKLHGRLQGAAEPLLHSLRREVVDINRAR